MNDLTALNIAIQFAYHCDAVHNATISIHELFRGQTIWKGDVEVFILSGCPGERKCYAWFDPASANEKPARFFSVLENNYIRSAEMAVKSVIFFDVLPRDMNEL